MKPETKVTVDMSNLTAKVIRTTTYSLFNNQKKRFIAEGDQGGFSAIEKREDGYYVINYLWGRDALGRRSEEGKYLKEEKVGTNRARELIREVLLERCESWGAK